MESDNCRLILFDETWPLLDLLSRALVDRTNDRAEGDLFD